MAASFTDSLGGLIATQGVSQALLSGRYLGEEG